MSSTNLESDLEQFRSEFEAWFVETHAREVARKDPNATLPQVADLYERFTPDVRSLADHVLSEWITSNDVDKRFTALALVHKFRIGKALEHLRVLESRLATQDGPEARFELKKVKRIIADFGE